MAQPTTQDGDGLKVINAGLFRMATKSMATAYQILGLKPHHGLMEGVMDTPWNKIEMAAEATWPWAPEARPRPPFQRADWDSIWGSYDVVTDLASPFAPELIKAYPNAKVVVVQRDFDSWWPSYESELLDGVTKGPVADIIAWVGPNLLGWRAVQAMRKIHYGFFRAKTRDEVIANARETYDRYYKQIREMVPPERRLEYKMGQGWEPLCTFLGVEVPDVDFPRVNDRASHQEEAGGRYWTIFAGVGKAALPWVIGVVAAGLAYRRWSATSR